MVFRIITSLIYFVFVYKFYEFTESRKQNLMEPEHVGLPFEQSSVDVKNYVPPADLECPICIQKFSETEEM